MMLFNDLKQKLDSELEVNRLGDYRKFKFINMYLNSKQETINFFINILKYKKWEANKVAYFVEYRKRRYQKSKVNKLVIPHVIS